MTVSLSRTSAHCAPKQPRQNLWARLVTMVAVRRQRRALKNLDAHLLHDIGLTPRDATAEAEKPVWDVPQYWSR